MTFKSPLRLELTEHRNPRKLVEHCINELRAVAGRGGPTGYGLEAKCAMVLALDNQDCARGCYICESPAPSMGDPLHYDSFIRTDCEHYQRRFR